MSPKVKKVLYVIGAVWLALFIVVKISNISLSRDVSSPVKAFKGHWAHKNGYNNYVDVTDIEVNGMKMKGGIIQSTYPAIEGHFISMKYIIGSENITERTLEFSRVNPYGYLGGNMKIKFSEDYKSLEYDGEQFNYVDRETSAPLLSTEIRR